MKFTQDEVSAAFVWFPLSIMVVFSLRAREVSSDASGIEEVSLPLPWSPPVSCATGQFYDLFWLVIAHNINNY